jgi:uncharacterized protein YegL
MNKLSAALVALLVLTGILWSGKHLLPAPASAAAPAADDSPCASTDPDTGLPLSSRVLIPDTIRECESTVVSATVRVSCGEIPLHVMLNVDRSGSMIGQAWLDAVAAARALVNTLELDRYNQTEVGLVTHGIQANVDVHLTNDGSRVTSRLAGMSPGGEDNLPQAIDRSRTELVNSRPRPGTATTPFDVMVILSDGGQTVPPSQATRSANKAKGANILVVAVCMQNQASSCPEMRKMATSAQYYFETRGTSGLTRVFSDIARQLREISLRQMDIQETLPAGTYLVPGSVSPDADIDPTGRVLSWQRRFVPSTGVTYTYEVTTSAPTTYTFANTLVTFQDSQDRNGTAMVPTKVLTVAGSCGVEIPTPSTRRRAWRVSRPRVERSSRRPRRERRASSSSCSQASRPRSCRSTTRSRCMPRSPRTARRSSLPSARS